MPIIRFFQLKLRYEHSMIKIFGRLATHNFVKNNIITPNYAYYEVVQLTLRNEYPTILIFRKAQVRYITNCCLTNTTFIVHYYL
jgi:hypothetical protein